MWWEFWKIEKNARRLPEHMSKRLAWRFSLDGETLARLRCASKPGKSGVLKTTFFRVYDPKLLAYGAPAIRGYDDLNNQQSAIQFECRWHRSKLQDVVDLRPAM